MGTDMSAIVEYRNPYNHTYECAAHVFIDRYYALYARMAGVRGDDDVEPVASIRGAPDSISWGAEGFLRERNIWERQTFYKLSYLTAAEFEEARRLAWTDVQSARSQVQLAPSDEYVLVGAVSAMMQNLPSARLIFWFH